MDNRLYADTITRGRVFLDPEQDGRSMYVAMGVNGAHRGQLYYFTFDNGTCLIPIKRNDKNVRIDNSSFIGETVKHYIDGKEHFNICDIESTEPAAIESTSESNVQV